MAARASPDPCVRRRALLLRRVRARGYCASDPDCDAEAAGADRRGRDHAPAGSRVDCPPCGAFFVVLVLLLACCGSSSQSLRPYDPPGGLQFVAEKRSSPITGRRDRPYVLLGVLIAVLGKSWSSGCRRGWCWPILSLLVAGLRVGRAGGAQPADALATSWLTARRTAARNLCSTRSLADFFGRAVGWCELWPAVTSLSLVIVSGRSAALRRG